jgi:hypothetical protein
MSERNTNVEWQPCSLIFPRRTIKGRWTLGEGQVYRRKVDGKWQYKQDEEHYEDWLNSQW